MPKENGLVSENCLRGFRPDKAQTNLGSRL